jgi:hypothetical protein
MNRLEHRNRRSPWIWAPALAALALATPREARADVPLCVAETRTTGSLDLNDNHSGFAADARAFSNRNATTFAPRATDASLNVSAIFQPTSGSVTLWKGPASGGDVEVGVRLRVVVDGVERCNRYLPLARQEMFGPFPGHYDDEVAAVAVSLNCGTFAIPVGSRSVTVEAFGESKMNLAGPLFGLGDAQGLISLRGRVTRVVSTHCTPFIDDDGDGANSLNDCNDRDSSRFPGNPELCDTRDNDCDGAVDEGVTTRFFPDADGDTFGGAAFRDVCARPAGFVTRGGDCNDARNTVNPSRPELCGDLVDNNCNGVIDDVGPGITGWRDGDGDGAGNAAAPTRACRPAAGYVSNDDDCNDANPALRACNTPVSEKPAGITCARKGEDGMGPTATLTCDDVTVAGDTTCVARTCDIDAPEDFSVSFTGECFSFATTATCEGTPSPAILCIEYDESTLVAGGPCADDPERCLMMFFCPPGEVCPSPEHPPLTRAPGTDTDADVFCAYVDEIPGGTATARASFASTAAGGVFVLGVDESDTDFDGIPASQDNCPEVYNPTQTDSDHDGVGDRCDG